MEVQDGGGDNIENVTPKSHEPAGQEMPYQQRFDSIIAVRGEVTHKTAMLMGQIGMTKQAAGENEARQLDIMSRVCSEFRGFTRKIFNTASGILADDADEDAAQYLSGRLEQHVEPSVRLEQARAMVAEMPDEEKRCLIIRKACHDANNKLGVITGYSGLLEKNAVCRVDANTITKSAYELHDYVSRITGYAYGRAPVRETVEAAQTTPGQSAAPAQTTPGQSAAPAITTARILMIDDEEPMRKLTERILSPQGHEVTTVDPTEFRDGEHVLDSVKALSRMVDLALVDMTMPNVSGWDVARTMHAENPGLPILFYTGGAEAIDLERAKEVGVVGVVKKPGDIPRLPEIIQETLARKT